MNIYLKQMSLITKHLYIFWKYTDHNFTPSVPREADVRIVNPTVCQQLYEKQFNPETELCLCSEGYKGGCPVSGISNNSIFMNWKYSLFCVNPY